MSTITTDYYKKYTIISTAEISIIRVMVDGGGYFGSGDKHSRIEKGTVQAQLNKHHLLPHDLFLPRRYKFRASFNFTS